jgi:hypothetical protein
MNKVMIERIALWFAVSFAVIMATLPKPPKLAMIDQFGDKFEHMLAFAVITLLAALAYPNVKLARIAERLSFLGALIEVAQSVPALHRDCDIFDWVADTVSILLMLTLVAIVRWQRTSPS